MTTSYKQTGRNLLIGTTTSGKHIYFLTTFDELTALTAEERSEAVDILAVAAMRSTTPEGKVMLRRRAILLQDFNTAG